MTMKKEKNNEKEDNVPRLIPARMLNEFTYCPRLCYIEWIQGDFVDSVDTLDGKYKHRRVDEDKGFIPVDPSTPFHSRSVYLSGTETGVVAKIDLVEGVEGKVMPVDYKRGKVPDVPGDSYEPERVRFALRVFFL